MVERARLLRRALSVSLRCSSCELRTLAPILCGRSCDHADLLLATQQRKLLSPDPTSDVCGRARLYVIRLSEEGSWGVARQRFCLISASMLNRHVPRVRQHQGREADREARESQGGVLGLFRLLLTRSEDWKYCVPQCRDWRVVPCLLSQEFGRPLVVCFLTSVVLTLPPPFHYYHAKEPTDHLSFYSRGPGASCLAWD